METESGGDTVEKTVLIDRTAVSGKTSPASSGKTASKPGTGAGFFRKKRKDVDLRIEELRGRRDPGDVNFSGDELPLDSLDDEYEIREKIAEGGHDVSEELYALKKMEEEQLACFDDDIRYMTQAVDTLTAGLKKAKEVLDF